MKRLFVLLTAVFFNLLPAHAARITWYKLDFPPYTIRDGIHQDKGLGDKIQAFVTSKLPELDHRTEFVTASKLYKDLDGSRNVCTVNSNYDVPTDQRRGISLPTNIYYNYHLVSRVDRSRPQTGALSLELLLKEKPGRLILDIGRPYQHLDILLEPHIKNGSVQLSSGASLSGSILRKMDKGQADYTLELCSTVRYLSATESYGHRFVCNEIVEHPLSIGRAAITCSRNTWGDKIIASINEQLLRYRGTKEYMLLMQRWYVPDDLAGQQQYWQQYRNLILAETTQTPAK